MNARRIAALAAVFVLCGCSQSRDADAVSHDAGPRGDGARVARPLPSDGGEDASSTATPWVEYTEEREPCGDRSATRNLYFGDLHVHTSYSFDAYGVDTRNDPNDAYRFARGQEIFLPPLDARGEGTVPIRIGDGRELDFAAVTDHSEFLGPIRACTDPAARDYRSLRCRDYRHSVLTLGSMYLELFLRDRPSEYCPRERWVTGEPGCPVALRSAWEDTIAAAEAAYDRSSACEFTTFVGYEYSGTPAGNMYHRNVIFRNADVPDVPISYFDAPTAPQLWSGLRTACTEASGACDVLAIPHSSNISGGILLTPEYDESLSLAEQRALAAEQAMFEPLMEIYQHKNSSECLPGFSSDEQCAFEAPGREPCVFGAQPDCARRNDYLRGPLQRGLQEQQRLGVNPLQYGVIASTDTHNGAPGSTSEERWRGHFGSQDNRVQARLRLMEGTSPGGLVAAWAVENSRDALFEAFRRRETYGTSGPRMSVRFFAGWGLSSDSCEAPDAIEAAYRDGVPMGGTLGAPPAGAGAPQLFLMAEQDRTPLEVAQIVKLWIDEHGEAQERVFDVDGGDAGASVDPLTCDISGAGYARLCNVWVDRDFDPSLPAVYYARVLEVPTCRWSQHDCNSLPPRLRPRACDEPAVIHERAWTSPIWYQPR